jgi:hypothetical protein
MGPRMFCKPVVADSHHFSEEHDPDPHLSEKIGFGSSLKWKVGSGSASKLKKASGSVTKWLGSAILDFVCELFPGWIPFDQYWSFSLGKYFEVILNTVPGFLFKTKHKFTIIGMNAPNHREMAPVSRFSSLFINMTFSCCCVGFCATKQSSALGLSTSEPFFRYTSSEHTSVRA